MRQGKNRGSTLRIKLRGTARMVSTEDKSFKTSVLKRQFKWVMT